MAHPYASGLDRNEANYTPLTPVSFLAKAAAVYPDRTAVIHGPVRRTWRETYARCRQLATALDRRGIRRGDRSKDVIISGGENISSQEVEDVLHGHPAVMLAAVVAQPDPKWGETSCAFVELQEGAMASEQERIDFCRDRMARFKAPKSVIFGALPKTSTGKVQKFLLRERAKSTAAIE